MKKRGRAQEHSVLEALAPEEEVLFFSTQDCNMKDNWEKFIY